MKARLNITIEESLLKNVKYFAEEHNTSVSELVENYFKMIVKTGFNQRRKTLRNALRPLLPEDISLIPFLNLRAEALSWEQFVILAKAIQSSKKSN